MTDSEESSGPAAEHQLAGRLRDLRTAYEWSQEEVAARMRRAGVNWFQSTVAKTEKSERPLRLNEAVALARIFRVRLADLVDDHPHPIESLLFDETAKKRLTDERLEWLSGDHRSAQQAADVADRRVAAITLLAQYVRSSDRKMLTHAIERLRDLHEVLQTKEHYEFLVRALTAAGFSENAIKDAVKVGQSDVRLISARLEEGLVDG